jgi:hypothetical protein
MRRAEAGAERVHASDEGSDEGSQDAHQFSSQAILAEH